MPHKTPDTLEEIILDRFSRHRENFRELRDDEFPMLADIAVGAGQPKFCTDIWHGRPTVGSMKRRLSLKAPNLQYFREYPTPMTKKPTKRKTIEERLKPCRA